MHIGNGVGAAISVGIGGGTGIDGGVGIGGGANNPPQNNAPGTGDDGDGSNNPPGSNHPPGGTIVTNNPDIANSLANLSDNERRILKKKMLGRSRIAWKLFARSSHGLPGPCSACRTLTVLAHANNAPRGRKPRRRHTAGQPGVPRKRQAAEQPHTMRWRQRIACGKLIQMIQSDNRSSMSSVAEKAVL